MLRNSSFCYWQLLVYVTEEATVLSCQKFEYGDAGWMPHCLGKTGYPFLLSSVFSVFHSLSCLLFAKLRIKYELPNIKNAKYSQRP